MYSCKRKLSLPGRLTDGVCCRRDNGLLYFLLGKRNILAHRTNGYDYCVNGWRSYIGSERLAEKNT